MGRDRKVCILDAFGKGRGLRSELRGCVSLRFGVDLVCGLCWGCDWVLGWCSAPLLEVREV